MIGALFRGPPLGIGLLTAGIILAIMIIPFIAAVMRDVFNVTPAMLKESAYAIGATTWEVMWNVVLSYTKVGVVGGIMLGLGRALGETMAVTFVIGNTNFLTNVSLFSPGNSITSALANEFQEADPGLHSAALIELGLILFLITFIVLAASKLLADAAACARRREDLRRTHDASGAAQAHEPHRTDAFPRRHGVRTGLARRGYCSKSALRLRAVSRSSLFTKMTPPPGSEGGLSNAIVGSLIMVGLAMLIGTPDRDTCRHLSRRIRARGWLAGSTRFINDILLSAPSIVIGLFVYAVMVSTMKSVLRRSRASSRSRSSWYPSSSARRRTC